jgi:hypothetical protein
MKTTQPPSKRIINLASKLLNLFCENGIRYFPPFESWAQQHSEEAWRSIQYAYVLDLAHYSLHGLTKKRPSRELVKDVLIVIEQWMIQSQGQLAQVTFENGTSSWLPVCLLQGS